MQRAHKYFYFFYFIKNVDLHLHVRFVHINHVLINPFEKTSHNISIIYCDASIVPGW